MDVTTIEVEDTVKVAIPEFITYGQEGTVRAVGEGGWITVHLGDYNGVFHTSELTLVRKDNVKSN